MTSRKLIILALLSSGCSLLTPKTQIIQSKDIIKYKKTAQNQSQCLNMNEKSCELFKLVNVYRSNKNLKPLLALENCVTSAQSHSENMYIQEKLKHNLKNSKWTDRSKTHGAIGELMAENVALASSAPQVLKQWINSNHHQKNLANKGFTHTGVGQKGRYWTQCYLKKFNK